MAGTFNTNNYSSNTIVGYTATTARPNNRHDTYISLKRHKDNENMTIYIYIQLVTSLSLCRMQSVRFKVY